MSKASPIPEISHESYLALIKLKQRENQLKIEAYDMQNWLQENEVQVAAMKRILAEKREAVKQSAEELSNMLMEVAQKPFGYEGKKVTISDAEPHQVIVVE